MQTQQAASVPSWANTSVSVGQELLRKRGFRRASVLAMPCAPRHQRLAPWAYRSGLRTVFEQCNADRDSDEQFIRCVSLLRRTPKAGAALKPFFPDDVNRGTLLVCRANVRQRGLAPGASHSVFKVSPAEARTGSSSSITTSCSQSHRCQVCLQFHDYNIGDGGAIVQEAPRRQSDSRRGGFEHRDIQYAWESARRCRTEC